MIKKYDNIYPVSLWVGLYSDWGTFIKKFDLYSTVNLLDSKEKNIYAVPILPSGSSGATYLVRPKNTDYEKGIAILLNEAYLEEGDYGFLLDLVSHETSHAADAIYQIIGEPCHTFDEGNEPRAYLVGWLAGRIGGYLSEYFKTIKDE